MNDMRFFGLTLIGIGAGVFVLCILFWIGLSLDGEPKKADIVIDGGLMLMLAFVISGFFFKHQADKNNRNW